MGVIITFHFAKTYSCHLQELLFIIQFLDKSNLNTNQLPKLANFVATLKCSKLCLILLEKSVFKELIKSTNILWNEGYFSWHTFPNTRIWPKPLYSLWISSLSTLQKHFRWKYTILFRQKSEWRSIGRYWFTLSTQG